MRDRYGYGMVWYGTGSKEGKDGMEMEMINSIEIREWELPPLSSE